MISITFIVLDSTHSYHHTALSEVLNRIVGKHITTHYLIVCTIFLLMWDLQILLFGPQDSLVQRRSMECQQLLCEDNENHSHTNNSACKISMSRVIYITCMKFSK